MTMWWYVVEWLSYGFLYVVVGPVAFCVIIGRLLEWWNDSYVRSWWVNLKSRIIGNEAGNTKSKRDSGSIESYFSSRRGLSSTTETEVTKVAASEKVDKKTMEIVSKKLLESFARIRKASASRKNNNDTANYDSNGNNANAMSTQTSAVEARKQPEIGHHSSSPGRSSESSEGSSLLQGMDSDLDIEVKDHDEETPRSRVKSAKKNQQEQSENRNRRLTLHRSSSGNAKIEQQRIESALESSGDLFSTPVLRREITAQANLGYDRQSRKGSTGCVEQVRRGQNAYGEQTDAFGGNKPGNQGSSVVMNVKSLWGEIAPHMSSSQLNLTGLAEEHEDASDIASECSDPCGELCRTNSFHRRQSIDSIGSCASLSSLGTDTSLSYVPSTTMWLVTLLALVLTVMLSFSTAADHCIAEILNDQANTVQHVGENNVSGLIDSCLVRARALNSSVLREQLVHAPRSRMCLVLGQRIPYFAEVAIVVDASKCALVRIASMTIKWGLQHTEQGTMLHNCYMFVKEHCNNVLRFIGEYTMQTSMNGIKLNSTDSSTQFVSNSESSIMYRWEFYVLVWSTFSYVLFTFTSFNTWLQSWYQNITLGRETFVTQNQIEDVASSTQQSNQQNVINCDNGDQDCDGDDEWGCHVELELPQVIQDHLPHGTPTETELGEVKPDEQNIPNVPSTESGNGPLKLHHRTRSSSVDTGLCALAGDEVAPMQFSLKSAVSRVMKQLEITKEFRSRLSAATSPSGIRLKKTGIARKSSSQNGESVQSISTHNSSNSSNSSNQSDEEGGYPLQMFQNQRKATSGDHNSIEFQQSAPSYVESNMVRLLPPERRTQSTPEAVDVVTRSQHPFHKQSASERRFSNPRGKSLRHPTFGSIGSPTWMLDSGPNSPSSFSLGSHPSTFSGTSSFFDIDFNAQRRAAEAKRHLNLESECKRLALQVRQEITDDDVVEEIEASLSNVIKQVAMRRKQRLGDGFENEGNGSTQSR